MFRLYLCLGCGCWLKKLHDYHFNIISIENRPDLHQKENGGSAGLLRCGKGSTWEGGIRVPAIAWWPGKIRKSRTHQLTTLVDLYPTIMKMARGKVPQDRKMDGIDMTKVLFRKEGKVSIRMNAEIFIWSI